MLPASHPHPQSSTPSAHTTSAGPLSPEHLLALEQARLRARKIRRAAIVAFISGGTLAFFAFITFLGVLFGDMVSLLLALGLGALAFNELRGGMKLRRFDPAAVKLLAYNQLALGALIFFYSVFMLFNALRDPMSAAGGGTGDPNMDATIAQLSIALSIGIYGSMAIIGIIGPGLSAWYYFSRAKYVRGMLTQTPPWVITTLRAAA
jgi:hypothetical protein